MLEKARRYVIHKINCSPFGLQTDKEQYNVYTATLQTHSYAIGNFIQRFKFGQAYDRVHSEKIGKRL
tara:strand:+ start:188 stop:388 length:201 start_codon:yes stop_codon:yes gene_type:complete